MDSKELSEWIAYDRVEPLPDSWVETGLTCATMANLWSKGNYKAQDFMPKAKKEKLTFSKIAATLEAAAPRRQR